MSEAAAKVWTLDEFLVWETQQERCYEFVEGEPRMMTGGTQAHSLIGTNIVTALRPRLRGTGCRPFGPDLRIPIMASGNSRYPDASIDCGTFDRTSYDASDPTIIFEVLSRSTAWYDQRQKLRDYEAVPSIVQYVCVSQFERRISIWLRDANYRFIAQEDVVDANASIDLRTLNISLPLSEIYEGLGLDENEANPV